jgi:hypothetical protein
VVGCQALELIQIKFIIINNIDAYKYSSLPGDGWGTNRCQSAVRPRPPIGAMELVKSVFWARERV